jgi:hypothetical protein
MPIPFVIAFGCPVFRRGIKDTHLPPLKDVDAERSFEKG